MTTKKIISLVFLCCLVTFSCVLAYFSATVVENDFRQATTFSTGLYAKHMLYSLEVDDASLWAYIPLLFGSFCFLAFGFTQSKRINLLLPLAFLISTVLFTILPIASSWIKKGIPEYSSAMILVFFSYCAVTLLLCAGFAALAWVLRRIYNKHVAEKLHFSEREIVVMIMCLQCEFGILGGMHFIAAISGASVFICMLFLVAPYVFPIIVCPILIASGIIWSILAKKEKPVFIFGNAVHLIFSFGFIWTIMRAISVGAVLQKAFELTVFRGEDLSTFGFQIGSMFLEEMGLNRQLLYILHVFLGLLVAFAIFIAIASFITFICKTIKKKKAAKPSELDVDSYSADYHD